MEREAIERLCLNLGHEQAELTVSTAMEEIAVWLSRCERLRRDGNRGELERLARLVRRLAAMLGMAQLGAAARAVGEAAALADEATLGAVVGRMLRLGEGSLGALWELQGLSV